jgi:hypothetical protein
MQLHTQLPSGPPTDNAAAIAKRLTTFSYQRLRGNRTLKMSKKCDVGELRRASARHNGRGLPQRKIQRTRPGHLSPDPYVDGLRLFGDDDDDAEFDVTALAEEFGEDNEVFYGGYNFNGAEECVLAAFTLFIQVLEVDGSSSKETKPEETASATLLTRRKPKQRDDTIVREAKLSATDLLSEDENSRSTDQAAAVETHAQRGDIKEAPPAYEPASPASTRFRLSRCSLTANIAMVRAVGQRLRQSSLVRRCCSAYTFVSTSCHTLWEGVQQWRTASERPSAAVYAAMSPSSAEDILACRTAREYQTLLLHRSSGAYAFSTATVENLILFFVVLCK